MRLSEYTDYTLRVLMFCAAHPGRQITIATLADHHGTSRNHLVKIVNGLAGQGVPETTRGRGGGLRLVKKPADIRVGDVVRSSETDFRLVECFDGNTSSCSLTPSCRLKGVFHAALQAYIKALDSVTPTDITGLLQPAGGAGAASRGARAAVPVRAPVTRRRWPAKHLGKSTL